MFLQNLRAQIGARLNGDSEGGFTLIELLVVMLILGILAAIAIPAFFNQRDKATDAQAKSAARTAETAMETYATENGGSYAGRRTGRPGRNRADAESGRGQCDHGHPWPQPRISRSPSTSAKRTCVHHQTKWAELSPSNVHP